MRAKTPKEIAAKYGISRKTMVKEIRQIPELSSLPKPVRLLNPHHIEIIIKYFGPLEAL